MLKFLELITLCFCFFRSIRTSTYSNLLFESNTSINYEEVLSNAEPRYKFHLEGSQDHLKHINSLDKTFKKHAQTLQTLKYTKSLSCEIEEFYNNNVKLRDFLLPITSENTSSISGSKESFFNFVLNKTRVAYSESTRVDQVIEKFLGLFPFLFEKEITNEVKIEQIRKFVKLFSGYHVYSSESKICEYNNELENFDTNFIQNNNFNVLYEIYDDIITKMDYNKKNNLVFTYLLGIKEMFSLNRNINLCTKILSEKVKEIHKDLKDLNTCDKVNQISKKSSLITKLSKFQNERIFSKMNDLIYNRNLKFKNSFLPLFNKVHEEWNKASYTKKLKIIGNVYHSSLSKEKEEFVISHLKELKNNLKFQISELERNKSFFSNKKDNESFNNFNFVQDSKIRRTSYKSNSLNSNVEFNSFLNYINSKYNSIIEKELTNNYDKIDNNKDKDVRVPTKKIKTPSNSGDFKCKRSRSYTKVYSWKRGVYPQISKNMMPENIQKSERVETELPGPSRDLHSNSNLQNNSMSEQSAGSKGTTNSESSSEDRVIDQYKQSQNDDSQSDAEISAGHINNDSEYVSIDTKTNSGSFQITVSSPITKNEIIKNDFTRVFQTYIYLEKSKQILEFLNHEIKEYIENPWYDTCVFLKEKISYKDNLIVMFKEISILRNKLISMLSVEDKTSMKQNKFFNIPKKFFYNEATLKILKEMFDNELENLEKFIKLLLTHISNQICSLDKKFYSRRFKSTLFNENYFEYYTISRTIDILKRDVNARFSAFFDFKSWVNNNLTRESIYNKKEAKITKLIDEYSKKFENQNKIPQKLTKFGSIVLYNSSPWQFTMGSLLYY